MTQPELPIDPPSNLDTETPVDWEEVAYTVGCEAFHRMLENNNANN